MLLSLRWCYSIGFYWLCSRCAEAVFVASDVIVHIKVVAAVHNVEVAAVRNVVVPVKFVAAVGNVVVAAVHNVSGSC